MKNSTHTTIQEIEKSVNTFFDCQQNESPLHLNRGTKTPEEILLEHLALAFQLIDRSRD